jgi:hypothetical protein
VTDTVNDVFRSGAIGAIIPPAPASPTAPSDNTGGPLNIRHIKRGHAFSYCTAAGDKTITGTSWAEVDPALSVRVATSDRPLLVEAGCLVASSAGTLFLSFLVDGVEVTGQAHGLTRNTSSTVNRHAIQWVATPGQGTHTIALAAKVSTSGSGTIYCADDVAVLAAREV